ncbi:hypothetical protein [Sphingomonas arenae]|uniref:hypothetical protein n=1 Tax=Sphingomonas arenae TaxID=2812555 RepID=UPI001967B43B|nr:hypothetical protein [Sphingomonas arenae]
MPFIALDHPVVLPVARLRTDLKRALPDWSWRCGDEDTGGPKDRATLERPQTILGRGADGMVMMSIALHERPLPLEAGAPPHQLHLALTPPSTENPELAKRIAVIACAALVIEQAPGAQVQIAPGGRWYDVANITEALEHCLSRERRTTSIDQVLGRCGRATVPAAVAGAAPVSTLETPRVRSPAEMMNIHADLERTFATILARQGGGKFAQAMGFAPPPSYADERPRTDRLPTLVMALGGPLCPDWDRLREGCAALDPEGGWTIEPAENGSARLRGRAALVELAFHEEPIPNYCIKSALSRSFWFRDGLDAFAGAGCQLVVSTDLDTRSSPYEDVRQTAAVISLVVGLLAGDRQAVAVLNAGTDTIMPAADVHRLTGCLANGELPLMLWTWTAPHSMEDGNVSLSTGGMLPFLGYEVEVWNASASATAVGDTLSGILKYLLNRGPVVSDGNSFGETPGDRSVRGFFGPSRAGRADPTQALLLEFDALGKVDPRPDPVPERRPAPLAAASPRPAPTIAAARPGPRGFGRKGL